MPVIEIDGVAGKQPSHQGGNRYIAGAKKKMGMIGNQRPRKTGYPSHWQKPLQARKKILPVGIVPKYLSALDPPDHDVMKGGGSV
jgi:hypothetical protein